jgi:hypothetical protein
MQTAVEATCDDGKTRVEAKPSLSYNAAAYALAFWQGRARTVEANQRTGHPHLIVRWPELGAPCHVLRRWGRPFSI